MKNKRIILLLATLVISLSMGIVTQSVFATASESDFTFDASTGTILKYIGSATSVDIPSQIGGVNVTAIGDFAFNSCGVAEITIPNGVISIGNGAFEFSELTKIIISNSVTSIGDEAFSYCYSLNSISVDESNIAYTSEDGALFNKAKSQLIQYPVENKRTSYIIPNSVTSIGVNAFAGCSSLTCVTIPSSVTSIGNDVFRYCYSLNSISVDENNIAYTSEDGALFNKARSQLIQYPVGNKRTSYIIPNSVTSIGVNAFAGCSSLTNVTIPYGVTTISNNVFESCRGLSSIAIPSSVTSISSYAFCYCTSLTSIKIPSNVISIGYFAFGYCRNLSSAYFYGNAPSAEDSVFEFTKSDFTVYYLTEKSGFTNPWNGYPTATFVNTDSAISPTKASFNKRISVQSDVITTMTLNGNTLRSITNGATSLVAGTDYTVFGNTVAIKKEYLSTQPLGITRLNFNFSAGDTQTLGIKVIETMPSPASDFTFDASTGTIIKYIGSSTSVDIPSQINGVNVTTISNSAFKGCSSLTSIIIPSSVTSIDYEAFSFLYSLNSLVVDENNIAYASKDGVLFNKDKSQLIQYPIGCISKNYIIPNSVISIADEAFANCSGLISVIIPNSVSTIGTWAFWFCDSLTSITIPNSVTSIGHGAFGACESLNSFLVDENNIAYASEDGVLFNKAKTQLIQYPIGDKSVNYTIPNSVTSIGYSAFRNCTNLTSITIPTSVTWIDNYAFEYSSLTEITIPSSVTSIGEGVFHNSSLVSIAVDENNITYASEDGVLFNKAKTLLIQYPSRKNGSYMIPNNVTSIGTVAFWGCDLLTSIAIPISVTSIGGSAFEECDSLTSIKIPSSVISIGYYAFSYCSNLSSAYFYGNAPSMGNSVFEGTKAGFTVYYQADKSGFTNPWNGYPTATFVNTDSAISPATAGFDKRISVQTDVITTMTLNGNTLRSITNGATSLVAGADYTVSGNIVTVKKEYLATQPLGITSLNFNFSAGDTQTLEITVIETVPSPVSDFSFDANTGTITKYIGSSTSVNIPSQIGGVNVTAIGGNAFRNCSSLTNITIPSSVTSIGNEAFTYCGNLTSINIPASVTSIGAGVFSGCVNLMAITVEVTNSAYTSVDGVLFNKEKTIIKQYPGGKSESYIIPDSVTTIGYGAFRGFRNLTSIYIPDGVTSIEGAAFADCNDLTAITVEASNTVYTSEDGVLFNKAKTVLMQYPGGKSESYIISNSVTRIDGWAFEGCSNLTGITIPDGVTSIGDGAFNNCSSLTSIIIPHNVTSIANWTFQGCNNLISIGIPSSVTSIGDSAFRSCFSLTSIAIPSAMTSIGYCAFEGCRDLTSVTIPNSVTMIGAVAFANCSGLTSATLSNSVTSIEGGTFADCSNLTSIAIPKSVSVIRNSAFYGCSSLTSIKIPNSVTLIEDNAFIYCSNLSFAYFYGNAPSIGNSVFEGTKAGFTVYYQTEKTGFANPWNGYPAATFINTFKVTYDGNGSTEGTVPVDVNAYTEGSTVTALGNIGSLVKTGYTFEGWNTAADGSGTNYEANATFPMGLVNVMLYAKWTAIIYGDVNGDGDITQNDYDLVKQFILGRITNFPSTQGIAAADIDGDGKITSKDYALLLRILRKN